MRSLFFVLGFVIANGISFQSSAQYYMNNIMQGAFTGFQNNLLTRAGTTVIDYDYRTGAPVAYLVPASGLYGCGTMGFMAPYACGGFGQYYGYQPFPAQNPYGMLYGTSPYYYQNYYNLNPNICSGEGCGNFKKNSERYIPPYRTPPSEPKEPTPTPKEVKKAPEPPKAPLPQPKPIEEPPNMTAAVVLPTAGKIPELPAPLPEFIAQCEDRRDFSESSFHTARSTRLPEAGICVDGGCTNKLSWDEAVNIYRSDLNEGRNGNDPYTNSFRVRKDLWNDLPLDFGKDAFKYKKNPLSAASEEFLLTMYQNCSFLSPDYKVCPKDDVKLEYKEINRSVALEKRGRYVSPADFKEYLKTSFPLKSVCSETYSTAESKNSCGGICTTATLFNLGGKIAYEDGKLNVRASTPGSNNNFTEKFKGSKLAVQDSKGIDCSAFIGALNKAAGFRLIEGKEFDLSTFNTTVFNKAINDPNSCYKDISSLKNHTTLMPGDTFVLPQTGPDDGHMFLIESVVSADPLGTRLLGANCDGNLFRAENLDFVISQSAPLESTTNLTKGSSLGLSPHRIDARTYFSHLNKQEPTDLKIFEYFKTQAVQACLSKNSRSGTSPIALGGPGSVAKIVRHDDKPGCKTEKPIPIITGGDGCLVTKKSCEDQLTKGKK